MSQSVSRSVNAKAINAKLARQWSRLTPSFLPFADAATVELPMARLLRLSLFQVTVGMAVVLLIGTLNRVMIVELSVPAWLVAIMVSMPLFFAPFRALVGFRSDTHRSVLGWRRVPFIWLGTLLQFGGLAIMPFALIILSGDSNGPLVIGQIAAGLAFLLVGAGLHTTQTVGLALATDLAPAHKRPRVVALLCVMMLVGMFISAVLFGRVLANFSEIRLIQVIQGSAVLTMVLNGIALWKQEARDPSRKPSAVRRPRFRESWRAYTAEGQARRRLLAVGLGTAGFSMQDILLEPYGGKVLHLSVGSTTTLTALLAVGGMIGLLLAARALARDIDPYRLAACGVLVGIIAFISVIFAAPVSSPVLFGCGAALIGFGGGLFAVGTLTVSMGLAKGDQSGLALGAWGAVQAVAAGGAIAISGTLCDGIGVLAHDGVFGAALADPATGYGVVYVIEIMLLLASLVAIGPLVRSARPRMTTGLRASATLELA
jgi:BCD family chlorophyll transporter-like MFS transporter